jgi:hypothetical protein
VIPPTNDCEEDVIDLAAKIPEDGNDDDDDKDDDARTGPREGNRVPFPPIPRPVPPPTVIRSSSSSFRALDVATLLFATRDTDKEESGSGKL